MSSTKWGATQNLLNLRSGTEMRIGYLHSNIGFYQQPWPAATVNTENNAIFIGIEQQVLEGLGLKLTGTQVNGVLTANQYQNIINYFTQPYVKKTLTAELDYAITPRDDLAFNVVRQIINVEFNSPQDGVNFLFNQLPGTTYAVAYRHNFSHGIFSAIQYQRNLSSYILYNPDGSMSNNPAVSQNVIFMRLGINF